jgi:hypothetical protein
MIAVESVADVAALVDGTDYLVRVFLGGCSEDCQLVVFGKDL